MLDGQINPREWYNWHPREFQPHYYDLHKFLYERHQWAHVHHLLCHQVYLKDMLRLTECPEPHTYVIDCRTDTAKMHNHVPNSYWLPRDEVEYALQLNAEEFLEMYAFPKPRHDEDIILFSHNGLASEQAGWEFKKAFYQHVYNYRGGTNELLGGAKNPSDQTASEAATKFGRKEGEEEQQNSNNNNNNSELYSDLSVEERLKPWKGPYPQSAIYVDEWSKRKLLQRSGPFDKRYEMQDFALPDLELERKRHPEEGPRSHMPYGIQ